MPGDGSVRRVSPPSRKLKRSPEVGESSISARRQQRDRAPDASLTRRLGDRSDRPNQHLDHHVTRPFTRIGVLGQILDQINQQIVTPCAAALTAVLVRASQRSAVS